MEIQRLLPVMLGAARILKDRHPDFDFVLPRASTIPQETLRQAVDRVGLEVTITNGGTYDIMSVADFAIATSGTVTLEAALCGLPCVILYKSSPLSFWIAKHVVEIPHIGLPNIVAGRLIEPELLQDQCTPEQVADTTEALLEPTRYARLKADLAKTRARLGEPGAVQRVADLVLRVAAQGKTRRLHESV